MFELAHGRPDRQDELEENETVRQKTRKYANRNSIHVFDTDVTETDTKSELVITKRERQIQKASEYQVWRTQEANPVST